MKIAVVGSKGSIGQRRMLILSEMGHKVTGYDVKDHSYFTYKEAEEFDAVFACVPPQQLTTVALQCIQAKTPFFLEKPGAISHRDLLNIVAKTEKINLITMVSCNLRFTAEYRAIQEALPNIGRPVMSYAEFGYFLPFWREGQYRTYYSCFRMAGGGVLMDAIHELDYMFSLFGHPDKPKAMLVTLENTKELPDLDAEDSANIHIIYPSGMSMTIHLDYLQRCYKRVFHVIGTKGRIDQIFNVQGSNDMYRREMTHFLECVKKGNPTIKPVEEHLKLLEFVDKVKSNVLPET